MPTLHITRGIPASGKSTWAKAWVEEAPTLRARVNRDDLRLMMFGAPFIPFEQEHAVTTAQRAAVIALLNAGRDVVVDDTHLRPRYIQEWVRLVRPGHAVEIHEFEVDPEVAIRRDAERAHPVGSAVIRKMVSRYLTRGHLQPFVPHETEETR